MKAVIFDLDGTLLDVSESIFWQYETLTREFNGFQASREAIAAALRRQDPNESVRHLVTNMRVPFNQVEQRHDQLREESLQHLRLYPHAEELLQILHRLGLRVGVLATDSDDTPGHMERLGLSRLVHTVITNEQIEKPVPHPEAIQRALRQLDALPHEAVTVSDMPEGIEAAKRAGVYRVVGITHGFGVPADLRNSGADHIVHDVPSLLDMLG